MRRLLPLLLLAALLLSACGQVETPTPIATPTTAPPPAATPTVESLQPSGNPPAVATGSNAEIRRMQLPQMERAAQGDAGAAQDTTAEEDVPDAVNLQVDLPQVADPSLSVRLPSLPGASARGFFAPEEWTVLVDEDFQEHNTDLWTTGELTGGATEIADGALSITAEEGWMISIYPRPAKSLSDGYVEATFVVEGDGSAGVLARFGSTRDDSKMYICFTDNLGTFACYVRVDGEWTELISGENEAIRPDEENTLALQIVGDSLVFSVNAEEVASFSDDSLKRGAWGVFGQSGTGASTARFTHVVVARPGAAGATATATPRGARPTNTAAAPTNTAAAEPTETAVTEPTDTPEVAAPTNTARATRTRLPARATATPTAAVEQVVVVDSDFEDGDSGTWPVGERENYTMAVAEGAYVMNLTVPERMLISYPQEAMDLEDATITAAVMVEGTGRAGVLGRWSKSSANEWNMYLCWIEMEGYWGCGKMVADQFSLVDSGASDAINADDYNTISLGIRGNQVVFAVNDAEVLSFDDEDLTAGSYGVWTESGDDAVTARFDRVTITQP